MDEIKNLLIFRTDRLGDFILTKNSINNLLIQPKKYKIDIVVSPKNYQYIKHFSSINDIFIFENSYVKFFLKNINILKKKYDYILIYDGKKRSHIISFFIKGKKVSFSKTISLYKIAKFFNYNSYLNSDYTVQLESFNFINLLLGEKNNKKIDFYFDYTFDNIKFNIVEDSYLVLHLDEKWFSGFYYHDFDYCNWSETFFIELINFLEKKFNLPIMITTGPFKIPFIDKIKTAFFSKTDENISKFKDLNKRIFLIENLTFRELEVFLKKGCKFLICCEGGISHVSHNLNIPTIAFVQGRREIFYRHWTGHMSNVFLVERGDQNQILNSIKNYNENMLS